MDKPIIDSNFIYTSLGQEMPQGAENKVYSALRMIEDVEKDSAVFLVPRTNDNLYTKVYDMLAQRHKSLPASDPTKLSEKEIHKEVFRFRLKKLADDAIKKGATLLICIEQIKDYPCLVVPSVENALFTVAECYRQQFDAKVVQITGSFGKTSVWQLVYSMLQHAGKNVHRNVLNGNDHRELLNTLMSLEKNHEFYVQETQEGPISWMVGVASKILKPTVGIITNIGATHLKSMRSKDNIAKAVVKIVNGMNDDSLLIINGDDPMIKKNILDIKIPIKYFGIRYGNAHYIAQNIHQSYEGLTFDIIYGENREHSVPIKMTTIGEHNIQNALAAFITGKHLGLTDDEIASGISGFESEGIRQNLRNVNGRIMYMDCFNASPETMSAAVKIISKTNLKSETGRRVAVLGNISELDNENEAGHMQVGYAVMQSNIDVLICYGHNAAIIAGVAKENPNIKIYKASEQAHLIQLIQTKTKPGDLILVKASRSAYIELAVDMALGTYFLRESEEAYKTEPITTIHDAKFHVCDYHTDIRGYIGDRGNFSIPLTVQGLGPGGKVVPCKLFGVSPLAFANNDYIYNIALSHEMKVIGEKAFYNCPKLKKVYIPPSVINISTNAFEKSPTTIYGEPNSYAHKYATENNLPFKEDFRNAVKDISLTKLKISDIKDPGYMALVNSENPMATIPTKNNLSAAELIVPVLKENVIFANESVLAMANSMFEAAKQDTIGSFYVLAAFRSLEEQQFLYDYNPKTGGTALPGHSEHHTGLALDIFSKTDMVNKLSQANIVESAETKWLEDNAHRFGFVLRYPKDKTHITKVPYEPWHFRFLGKVHAFYMKQHNLVYEEYLERLKKEKKLTIDMYGKIYYVLYQTPKDDSIEIPANIGYTISSDNTGGYIITADPDNRRAIAIESNPRLVTIGKPRIDKIKNKSRLVSTLKLIDRTDELWMEVDNEYEKYLTTEKSDAFLIGLLHFAMRMHYDIKCEAPVSTELLYNLENHLIPTLKKSTAYKYYTPTITCTTTNEPTINNNAVGTGMSLGLDSMHALFNHMPSGKDYSLTHLLFGNFGNFKANYNSKELGIEEGTKKIQTSLYNKAKKVATAAKLPLVFSDTNISDFYLRYNMYFESIHSYCMAFTVHSLAKLFSVYLFGSGPDYNQLNFSKIDPAYYDSVSMPLLSVKGLQFYSEGAPFDRMEKTQRIINFDIAQENLNVCVWEENNCGKCYKCQRTMLSLDLLGHLEDFSAVFPVDYYKENFDEYLTWLAENMQKNESMDQPLWEAMQNSRYKEQFLKVVETLNESKANKETDNSDEY